MNYLKWVLCSMMVAGVMFSGTGPVHAAVYDVQILPGGFSPVSVSIEVGDYIHFYNFTGMAVSVTPSSSNCPPWGFSLPYPGDTTVQFNCTPGMEIGWCPEVGDSIYIDISAPAPTPTPDVVTPATSPAGIGLTLVLMGIALSLTFLKRRV